MIKPVIRAPIAWHDCDLCGLSDLSKSLMLRVETYRDVKWICPNCAVEIHRRVENNKERYKVLAR